MSAAGLQAVAELQKRSVADLAVDLLDRNLPRLQTGGMKKGKDTVHLIQTPEV